MKLILCVLLMFSLQGCERYGGHNGYDFAWRDFERAHLHLADLNKDGIVTNQERETVKSKFLTDRGWVMSSRDYEVYDSNGTLVEAKDFVAEFTKGGKDE